MTSKLSYHVSDVRRDALTWDAPARAQVRVLKCFSVNMESEQYLQRFLRECPIEILVFRPGYKYWSKGNPVNDADPNSLTMDAVQETIGFLKQKNGWPHLTYEGLNEPSCQSADDFKRLNEWYCRFAEVIHAMGDKCAAFSFSTGNPTPERLQHLSLLADAIRVSDYIALHEYHHNFGYYRRVWDALPVKKPVILTETGFDNGGNNLTDGWLGNNGISANTYVAMMQGYDQQYLQQDPYILGATIFQLGDPYAWKSFEMAPIAMPLADYIASQGGGAPVSWTPEPPAPEKPVYKLSVDKTDVQVGDRITFSWLTGGIKEAHIIGSEHGAPYPIAGNTGTLIIVAATSEKFWIRATLKDGTTDNSNVVTVTVKPAADPLLERLKAAKVKLAADYAEVVAVLDAMIAERGKG